MSMAFVVAMVAVAVATTSPAAAWGIGDGGVGGAREAWNNGGAAAYAPLYCGGTLGNPDDDYAVNNAPSDMKVLWVNLTYSECKSTTLPLLVSYLGTVTAGDLVCIVGPPDLHTSARIS